MHELEVYMGPLQYARRNSTNVKRDSSLYEESQNPCA